MSGTPGRLLLVDPDSRSLQEAWDLLDALGYEVVGCTSIADAILAILRRPDEFDAILCDVAAEVPGETEFHDQIAAVGAAVAERIVWLTAAPDPRGGRRSILLKPLDADAVRACVDEYVVHRTIAPVTER